MSLNKIKTELSTFKGATFATIDTSTVVKVRKTLDTEEGRIANPHYDNVIKHVFNLNVMVFTNSNTHSYVNMVKKRLEEEGKDPSGFVVSPRPWGERIKDTCLVEHKGKFYAEVVVMGVGDVLHTLNNKEILVEDIKGLPAKTKPEQGGLDNKVIVRTFALENIKRLTMNKKTITQK